MAEIKIITAPVPGLWQCYPCNYDCSDHCLLGGGAAEKLAPKILNRTCKCNVEVRWCQYPACGAKSCITFNCTEQFVLIQEVVPAAISGGCPTCPNPVTCAKYGNVCRPRGQGGTVDAITCGPKCGSCGDPLTLVDGAWLCFTCGG